MSEVNLTVDESKIVVVKGVSSADAEHALDDLPVISKEDGLRLRTGRPFPKEQTD